MTGEFNTTHKNYFDAGSGAYTSITQTEIDKQTFNVKAAIKNLLILKLGKSNIPTRNSSQQHITFKLFGGLKAVYGATADIICKFSKPDKDEMSIYFSNHDFIDKSKLHDGDVWCIFFRPSDKTPWFGLFASGEWDNITRTGRAEVPRILQAGAQKGKENLDTVRDENAASPTYEFDISSLQPQETDPPGTFFINNEESQSGRKKVISKSQSIRSEANKQARGRAGETVVLEFEKRRLCVAGRPDLVPSWVAKDTDGDGYDIISYNIDESGVEHEIYIEVKTTSAGIDTPFNISANEVSVSREKGNSYYIYRLYNFNPNENKSICYYKINGSVEQNFHLKPAEYLAYKK